MKRSRKSGTRGTVLLPLLGTIFFAFQFAEADLQRTGDLSWSVRYAFALALRAILCGTALGLGLLWLLSRGERAGRPPLRGERPAPLSGDAAHPASAEESSKREFFLSWAMIFAAYLPYFLAYYPGICAYDAYIQIGQCVSGEWNEHHPFLHTMFLNLFWQLGGWIGNRNAGIALFVLFQMAALSFAFAFSVRLLGRRGLRRTVRIALLVIAALYPYHAFIAISVTKAGLFSAAFVLAGSFLLAVLTDGRESLAWGAEDWGYFALLFPVVFFRSNARYAVAGAAILAAAAALCSRRRRKLYARVALASGAGLFLSLVILGIVFRAAEVTQGDRREMLSVPIQQLARTALLHEDELTADERTALDGMILDEAWRAYDPVIADPVKRRFNTSYLLRFPAEALGTYCSLLGRYPGDFLNAVLALDAGYLYGFDRTCLEANENKTEPGLGFVQTRWADEMYSYGVSKEPVLPGLHEVLERWTDANLLQRIPVLGWIFLPGWVLWAVLFGMAAAWVRRKERLLLPLALCGLYLATLLLGPVVQMRYIFPVWASLPALLAGVFAPLSPQSFPPKRAIAEHLA